MSVNVWKPPQGRITTTAYQMRLKAESLQSLNTSSSGSSKSADIRYFPFALPAVWRLGALTGS